MTTTTRLSKNGEAAATLRDSIALYIRAWGPESPEEPGAADNLAGRIISEVEEFLEHHRPPPVAPHYRMATALERIATLMEQDYLDRRGRGAKLPKVRR